MTKRCAKCRKEVQEDLFLCPHCGAIYGEPIYRYKKARRPIRIPGSLRYLCYLGLLAVAVISFILIWNPGNDSFPQTTGEKQVTYSIKLQTQFGNPVSGAKVLIRSDSHSEQIVLFTDAEGLATVTYPADAYVTAEVLALPESGNSVCYMEIDEVIVLTADSLNVVHVIQAFFGLTVQPGSHSYTITIINDLSGDIGDLLVEFYTTEDPDTVYVQDLDSQFKATQTLNIGSGSACVRLCGMEYVFAEGEFEKTLYLSQILTNEPVYLPTVPLELSYVVKVTDTLGNPVQNAGVGFDRLPEVDDFTSSTHYDPRRDTVEPQVQYTDEDGICVFYGNAVDVYCVYICSLPDGYYCDWQDCTVMSNGGETTLKAYRTEDGPYSDEQSVFGVTIQAGNDIPLRHADVLITYRLNGAEVTVSCQTNDTGTITFLCDKCVYAPVVLQITIVGETQSVTHRVEVFYNDDLTHYTWTIQSKATR